MDKAFKQIRQEVNEREYIFYTKKAKDAREHLDINKAKEFEELAKNAYERRKKDLDPDDILKELQE